MTFDSKSNKFTKEQLDRINKMTKGNIIFIREIKAVGTGGIEQELAPLMLVLN